MQTRTAATVQLECAGLTSIRLLAGSCSRIILITYEHKNSYMQLKNNEVQAIAKFSEQSSRERPNTTNYLCC